MRHSIAWVMPVLGFFNLCLRSDWIVVRMYMLSPRDLRSDLRVTETELRGARAQLQFAFDQLSSTRGKLEETQASENDAR